MLKRFPPRSWISWCASASAKQEFEGLVQRSVDGAAWAEAQGHAKALSEWFQTQKAKAAKGKYGQLQAKV